MVKELEAKLKELTATQEPEQQSEHMQPETLEAGHKDEEWQKIILSCQKKDQYIADLEKHVVFYKSKAKQVQGQLQQLIRDSIGNQEQSGETGEPHTDVNRLQSRIQQLEEANDTLMKDLASAKA